MRGVAPAAVLSGRSYSFILSQPPIRRAAGHAVVNAGAPSCSVLRRRGSPTAVHVASSLVVNALWCWQLLTFISREGAAIVAPVLLGGALAGEHTAWGHLNV